MRKSRKIFISILTFTLAIMLLTTVTFAWISMSAISNIDGLGITATSGSELEISIDGENYSSQLPSILIQDLIGEMKLYDVTTLDGINFQTGGFRDVADAIPNEHYLTFDLWFRTVRNEKSLYLINNIKDLVTFDSTMPGTYVISRGVFWVAPVSFLNGPDVQDLVEKGDLGVYYGSDTIRISVIEQNDDTNPMDVRTEDELERFIYDPSEDLDRGYGKLYGAYNYFFQTAQYWMDTPKEIQQASYRLTQFDPNNPYQALDNESKVGQMIETEDINIDGKTYYRTKVTINIWIEGWDADTFDAVDKDVVKIQLQFKSAMPAEE
jgi:hypothetical protein